MADQVQAISSIRLRVVAALKQYGPMTQEAISEKLWLPESHIRPALESAEVAGLAEPTADGVWGITAPARAAA